MAKFIKTKQVLNHVEENIVINAELIIFARKIAADASEITFVNGKVIIVKTPIEDFL